MYKYSLSNKRRSNCPFCGKQGKYSAYMNTKTGELAPMEYGMCSSCQKSKRPPDNYVQGESTHVENDKLAYYEADTLMINTILQYYKPKSYIHNSFIEGLEIRFGQEPVARVVDLFKLGKFEDSYDGESSAIVFPYLYTNTHCCTGKLMWFDNDLHRIKEGKKQYPRFLHNLNYIDDCGTHCDFNEYDTDDDGNDVIVPFKLKMCLFGHHQIINDKTKIICLVESEKTAVIMSIVLPEFIWVASGGKTLIQDYKFLFFTGRKCLVFPDLSEDDKVYQYWFEKLTYYNRKYGYDFEIVDYYSDFLQNDSELIRYCKCEGKFDIADFVLGFNTNDAYMDFIKNKLDLKIKKASFRTQILIPEVNAYLPDNNIYV
jgi:hypothetical protein